MPWNSAVSPSTLRYTGTLDPFCIYSPFFNNICSTIPPQKTLLSTSGTFHFSVLDLTDNFFLPHSTFSLQISLLSPELTLICFFSHRSPNCPTSGFPRQPTPIWSGPSFWPSLFVSPQIEIREYIDDIILCDPSLQISQTNTFALLNFLSSQGYRVLSSKVRLFTPQVICLGLNITPTHKAITFERKHLIQSLAILSTKEEILSFLEITYIPGPPLSPSLLTPYISKPLAPHMKPFSFLSPFRSSIRISSRFQPFISQS